MQRRSWGIDQKNKSGAMGGALPRIGDKDVTACPRRFQHIFLVTAKSGPGSAFSLRLQRTFANKIAAATRVTHRMGLPSRLIEERSGEYDDLLHV
jgi:hypothetical protein